MRNFWVAIIGVLTITLFAGTSFATAPMVQDIPDFKLLTGSQAIDSFDLNDYVTDYDDPVSSLDWTIDGAAYNATLSGTKNNMLAIAGSASVGQGVNAFRVHDATQSDAQSVDTSVVKYSSLMVSGPGLTQDNNLVPPNAFKRTWVVEADRTLTTPAISTLITPAGTYDLSVSIADLNGNLLDGNNTTSAVSGDLQAVINVNGELELSAPAGKYPLAGAALTGAYRVGVKAKLSGGPGLAEDAANWDGAELLVSTARMPARDDATGLDLARLDRFNNFEVDTAAALPTSPQAMRLLSDGENAHWYKTAVSGSATADIVASAPTGATTTWASSGKALKVTIPAAGAKVAVRTEFFTDIQPGEKLILQANVTTSVEAGQAPVDIWMFMGTWSIASNYQGICLQAGTNPTTGPAVPVGGAYGWRTLKTSFTADTVGANVQGATTTVNFYGDKRAGYQANFTIVGSNATAPYPVDVYIDNVRIYKSGSALDNALASTDIPVVYKNLTTEVIDGTFESASDLSKLEAETKSGTGAAVLNDNVGNNSPFHNGTKSLAMYLPGATPTRTGASAELVRIRAQLNTTPAGGKDYSGPGIYGFSFWFKTDAPDVASTPGIFAYMADGNSKNLSFVDTGYVGCPLAGQGWKKVELTATGNFGVTPLAVLGYINVRCSATAGALTTNPWWGEFTEAAKKPSAEEDATVFIDDVKFHKVLDEATYFDRSVFPVAD